MTAIRTFARNATQYQLRGCGNGAAVAYARMWLLKQADTGDGRRAPPRVQRLAEHEQTWTVHLVCTHGSEGLAADEAPL